MASIHEATDDDRNLRDLYDLFAGRITHVLGENLEWWMETPRCDLSKRDAAGVALAALSDHPADRRAAAAGIKELRAQLLARAHMLTNGPGAKVQP